jgi:exodeoxyribonuclease V alpha subunit
VRLVRVSCRTDSDSGRAAEYVYAALVRSPPTPQAQPAQPQVAVLDGVLERVTFCNPETGYTIARIAPDRGTGRGPVSASTELITVVGPLLGAQIGESLRLRGCWSSYVKYGRQFDAHSYTTVLPATEQGIRRHLGSGLIRGIGPVMAERMVARFGVDIMHVIDDEPQRLVEVPGLGPKRSARIKDAWAEQNVLAGSRRALDAAAPPSPTASRRLPTFARVPGISQDQDSWS